MPASVAIAATVATAVTAAPVPGTAASPDVGFGGRRLVHAASASKQLANAKPLARFGVLDMRVT